MSSAQDAFEKEYKETVKREADFIMCDLKDTAMKKHYETDIFIRHVINELNRLNKQREVRNE